MAEMKGILMVARSVVPWVGKKEILRAAHWVFQWVDCLVSLSADSMVLQKAGRLEEQMVE
jgi:hypothetical protein